LALSSQPGYPAIKPLTQFQMMNYFLLPRIMVALPNQAIVRTGFLIKDIQISKKCIALPFQTADYVELKPHNYSFNLSAMSSQKLEFTLPAVFTIGPKPEDEPLQKYAKFLFGLTSKRSENTDKANELTHLIQNVISGELRTLVANMTIDDIFSNRSEFKNLIVKNVESELEQFGLTIFNANIQELADVPGSSYFKFRRQKILSEAEADSLVNIAESERTANVGKKSREVETRKRCAELEAQAVEMENESKSKIMETTTKYEIFKANREKEAQIAQYESTNMSAMRNTELMSELERMKIDLQTQSERAKRMSMSQVNAEVATKDAEGQRAAIETIAQAKLFQTLKEAEGEFKIFEARANGIRMLNETFGDDPKNTLSYLMMKEDLYEKLANANANAIKGLNPKFYVMGDAKTDIGQVIRDVGRNIPPLLDIIQEQTGIKPPSWMVDRVVKAE